MPQSTPTIRALQVNQVSQQGQVVHGGLSANHASLNPDGLLDSEITFLANHLGLDFQQLRRPPVGLEDPDPESNPLASDGQVCGALGAEGCFILVVREH